MFMLVCYDVVENRTELFRKTLGRWLHWTQNSVFSGEIDEAQKIILLSALREITRKEDSLLIFEAKNRRNVKCCQLEPTDQGFRQRPVGQFVGDDVVL